MSKQAQIAESIIRTELTERGEDFSPARQNANVLSVSMKGMNWLMGPRIGGAWKKFDDNAWLDGMTYIRNALESIVEGKPDMARAYFKDASTQFAKVAASVPKAK